MLAQATTPAGVEPSKFWIVVGVVVAVVIIALIAYLARRARSQKLQQRFGPEYERTVEATGSEARAESELAAREKRHEKLHILPLTSGARTRYAEEWREVQARFVDEPFGAIAQADTLLHNVMRDRGYPVEDFDQQLDDLSVEHSRDIDHYRAGHAIALRCEARSASTEDSRQAMVHYRALFESLLGGTPVVATVGRG
jgi:hypothetical protein